MTQPEPPHVVIIGLKEVLEEVKSLNKNHCDFVNRIDVFIAGQTLRTAALEESAKTSRDAIALLKENAVTRPAMWVAIGALAGVGAVAVGAIALFK
jgi:hypothetical protein